MVLEGKELNATSQRGQVTHNIRIILSHLVPIWPSDNPWNQQGATQNQKTKQNNICILNVMSKNTEYKL